ncbi:MAG TPA: extracellular solute-binding protein [Chloroflexota bacterium]|nr:extracellular solute-binding protein [Chloroflexota bacterium]
MSETARATIVQSNQSNTVSRRGMIRTATGLLGAASAGVLGAACGAPGGAPGQEGAPAASLKPVTIRWSTWGDANNPFNPDAAPKGLEIFNEKYPQVKVEIEPQLSGWPAKNTAAWIAGDGPDISGHCCQYGPTFARQGFLVNMDSRIKRDSRAIPIKDYVEWLIDLFRSPEHGQFALPMYTGTKAIYYNKELFKKRGLAFPDGSWDWNKYRDLSLKLTDIPNNRWGRVQAQNLLLMRQNGGHMVDPKDDRKAAFDSAASIEAMQYERDSIHKDRSVLITGGPKAAEVVKGIDSYQRFASGYHAMWESGSWILTRMVKFVGDAIEWDVAPMPKGPKQRDTLATNDGWSIWNGSKAVDESWELVKFLQGDAWMEIATRIVGQQTARKSFQEKWVKLTKEGNPALADKNLNAFVAGIKENYARPIELWRDHPEANKIFSDAYNKAVRDGEADVASTMKEAAQRVAAHHGV